MPTLLVVSVLEVIAISVGLVKAASLAFCHLTILPVVGVAVRLLAGWLPAHMVWFPETVPALVTALIVSDTALVKVVAFVLVADKLPDGVPVADAATRTYMVVVATVPVEGVNETVFAKPDPEVVETSNPVGAVTTRAAVKLVPETVYDCSAETEPLQEVKDEKVPVCTRVGGGAIDSV